MAPQPKLQVETDPEPLTLDNPAIFPRAWRCDPVNGTYVKRFLALAQACGIPVYWVIPPYKPAYQAGRERIGADAAYTRFARSLQARFPNLRVLDGRHLGLSHRAFGDGIHLNSRGASAFSESVAEALSRHPDDGHGNRPRWVDLPPVSDRAPAAVDLEDLETSRTVAGAARGAVLR
jgi:hypothetical protein